METRLETDTKITDKDKRAVQNLLVNLLMKPSESQ